MKKYYIGMKLCGYYAVHIIENEFEDVEMVEEENINGFIQCLEYLGFVN